MSGLEQANRLDAEGIVARPNEDLDAYLKRGQRYLSLLPKFRDYVIHNGLKQHPGFRDIDYDNVKLNALTVLGFTENPYTCIQPSDADTWFDTLSLYQREPEFLSGFVTPVNYSKEIVPLAVIRDNKERIKNHESIHAIRTGLQIHYKSRPIYEESLAHSVEKKNVKLRLCSDDKHCNVIEPRKHNLIEVGGAIVGTSLFSSGLYSLLHQQFNVLPFDLVHTINGLTTVLLGGVIDSGVAYSAIHNRLERKEYSLNKRMIDYIRNGLTAKLSVSALIRLTFSEFMKIRSLMDEGADFREAIGRLNIQPWRRDIILDRI